MARFPSKKFRRVYWDSCTWISLIQNETAVLLPVGGSENRASLARAVLNDAEKGAAEIVTSALSLAEVNKPAADPTSAFHSVDKIADFFENDFIIVSMLDRTVGELARLLMQTRHPGLKPLDAVHVASALVANVDELHSFDQKLLDLDEKLKKLDGKPLKVCKPSLGGPPLPLLEPPPQILDASYGEDEVNDGDEPATDDALGHEDAPPLEPVDNGNAKAEP